MDKDIDIWKQRNEILHKKVNIQMEEIKELNKKSETIFDLARRFPNKTYRELEGYKNADRQEEAQSIPLTESQRKQEELEPIEEEQRLKKETGACITAAIKRDKEAAQFQKTKRAGGYVNEMKEKIKELEIGLANALEVNESHRKMNGKLQERLTEVEEENKKLKNHFENRIDAVRKSGM